jgi:hypothetical protein
MQVCEYAGNKDRFDDLLLHVAIVLERQRYRGNSYLLGSVLRYPYIRDDIFRYPSIRYQE